MTARELVCTCEDVTRGDVERAIARGHTDMESLKRYTGLGTGICQGRGCLARAAQLLTRAGYGGHTLAPTSARPPLWPVPLAALAAGASLPPIYPSEAAPAWTPPPPMPAPPEQLPSLPTHAQVVIIGGGIMGLATAYHLAKCGLTNVVVLEASYLNAGASGRNGGGIREQWSTEQHILLMRESIALCRELAKELGINVWLRQGGYLFVTAKEKVASGMGANVELQNRLGVPSRMLRRSEMQHLVPELETSDLVAAVYNPEDGVIFPWPFLWGYAEGARQRGVHIATFTPATHLLVEGGRVCGVVTPRGTIRTELVVNAAAAWAPEIARMAGVTLPNRPERHEILVTESLRPFLGPLVSELGLGLYFSQSLRGEVVGGLGDPDEPVGVEMRSSQRFLVRMARALVHRMPRLGAVKVLRQWAGCYDVTPDGNPIVGEVDEVAGFFQLHGFVGHGFMMAPVVGRIVGEYLAKGTEHPFVHDNRLHRFARGDVDHKETMIIG